MKMTETKKTPIFNGLIRQEYIQEVINILYEYEAHFTLNSVNCDIMHISLFAEFKTQDDLNEFTQRIGSFMCQKLS